MTPIAVWRVRSVTPGEERMSPGRGGQDKLKRNAQHLGVWVRVETPLSDGQPNASDRLFTEAIAVALFWS